MAVTKGPIPMTLALPAIETFADAIAVIAASPELPEQTRRHWPTSLRTIAKLLNQPLEVIPARYSALRPYLAELHHAPAGLTRKTVLNHQSNAKTALLWLELKMDMSERGIPLTPAWEELRRNISHKASRWKLASIMRFCSASSVAAHEVDEAVIDRFMAHRARTGKASQSGFRRELARLWNGNVGVVPGWP